MRIGFAVCLFVAALILCAGLIAHLFLATSFHDAYVRFFEANLSPDARLDNPFRVFGVLALLFVWSIVFCLSHIPVAKGDVDFSSWHADTAVLILGCLVIVASWFTFKDRQIYQQEALVETVSAAIAFAAAFIFFWVALLRSGNSRFFHLLWGVALLLVGMEEISWGQQFFHWHTPEAWEKLNAQGETNFHNLLNFAFFPIYFFVPLILAVAFLNRELVLRIVGKMALPRLFVPSQGYILLAHVFFFLSLSNLLGGTELTEQVCYFIALVFAIQHLRSALAQKARGPAAARASTTTP